MEAIVLAGGFGMRLKSLLPDAPKPMAPIRGTPFLEYLLHAAARYDVSHFILCTGFMHEVIETHFNASFMGIPVTYSVEERPLGTGGALLKALSLTKEENCLALNGDSFFDVDLASLFQAHVRADADFTIALKKMRHFDRYGTVLRKGSRVVAFEEKRLCDEGEINGGVYAVRKSIFFDETFPEKFSLERDFLEKKTEKLHIEGIVYEGYFIDIGVPEDYRRAERELGMG